LLVCDPNIINLSYSDERIRIAGAKGEGALFGYNKKAVNPMTADTLLIANGE